MPQSYGIFSSWYTQCSKSLIFQKSTKNLLISEIISTFKFLTTEHRIASLGATWNMSNVLMIYA